MHGGSHDLASSMGGLSMGGTGGSSASQQYNSPHTQTASDDFFGLGGGSSSAPAAPQAPPLPVILSADKGKGLTISGRVTRQNGQIGERAQIHYFAVCELELIERCMCMTCSAREGWRVVAVHTFRVLLTFTANLALVDAVMIVHALSTAAHSYHASAQFSSHQKVCNHEQSTVMFADFVSVNDTKQMHSVAITTFQVC